MEFLLTEFVFSTASGYCLITIGTFTALLFITSQSVAEAELYRETLDNFRWLLRVSSSTTEHMDFAVQKLDLSLSHIHQLTAAEVVGHAPDQSEESEPNRASQQPGSNNSPALRARSESLGREPQSEQDVSSGWHSGAMTGLSGTSPMSFFYEDAILNAIGDEPLLPSSVAQQHSLLPSFLPETFTFDAEETTPRTLEYDYQQL